MRYFIAQLICGVVVISMGRGSAAGQEAKVPLAADVREYRRTSPVFESTKVAVGPQLLDALDGGRGLKPWRPAGDPPTTQPIGCYLPMPRYWCITLRLKDDSEYQLGFCWNGGLAYLPNGDLFEIKPDAQKVIEKLLAQLDDELKQEIAHATKPCKYKVGSIDDRGTLSGISRLFYGKPSRWKLIYEANRDVLKNPDQLKPGIVLTIPAEK